MQVSGSSLDNRNNGTLSSRNGDVGVTLSGALLNSAAGALVGQKKLTVSAASLDNRGGILSSGGDQTLTVTGGSLNNAQGGLIDSGATLVMNTMTLGNAGGTVNAQKALSFTGTSLDNSGGNLIGNAAVTLNLKGALDNHGAKLASAGPLTVKDATAINNQGGQLVSQGEMTLGTGTLDNSHTGTVAAKNVLTITASRAVQNHTNGLIYSQTADVELNAASLANGQGEMQGQTGVSLELRADLDNQGGKLIAQTGDVNVTAANIDNRGGILASLKGSLEARTVGVLRNGLDVNNKGGVIQGQRLDLRALAGLNNNGGRIAAQTGDIVIDTASLNNRSGGLYASGLIKVSGTGASLDNTAGQIAGNAINLDLDGALTNRGGILESDSTLVLSAASLDNQTGQLRALGLTGKTDFQIGSLFDNRNGKLESVNSQLTLAANSFLNGGGQLLHLGADTFDISLANVTGAGGDIVTRGGLTLKADTWTNTSAIQAGRLTVDVNNFTQTETGQLLASTQLEGKGGNWVNNGLIASDGGLGLQLTGRYSGNGRVTSLGDMTVDAAAIDLSSVASITGGGTTTIGGRGGLGSLNNYGRLTSAGALNITAGTINNYGTVAGADGLKLTASTLLNDQGGFLFSGADMKLRVGSFTNRKSDVYALENIDVARNDLGGRSALMENDSGTMESGRDFSINADSIINKRGDFKTEAELYSSAIGFGCYSCDALPQYFMDERQPDSYYVYEQKYRVSLSGDLSSKAASLSSSGNMSIKGGSFLNSNSSVSAAGNVDISVGGFENSGSALGDYVSREFIAYSNPTYQDMAALVKYNIYNDAGYNEGMRFWNSSGIESTTYTQIGRDGGKPNESEYWQRFGPIAINIGMLVERVRTEIKFTESQYSTGTRMAVPDFIKNSTPFNQVVVSSTSSDSLVPAIIQAGGNVSITATNKITNGVERPFSTGITTSSRNTTTAASGSGKTTVVTLNSQLPPDLAQQQINPLTLPGFSLPTGQNGLFRLSGQGASDASSSQTPVVSQNWTIGGASVSASNRSTATPTANVRDIQIADVTQVSTAERQVQLLNRENGGVTAGASAIQVTAPTDSSTGTPQLPGHSLDGTITRGVDIALDTSSTPSIGVSRPTDASVSAPTPVNGQTVARVTGLPSTTVASTPHKYLIETNPVLTDLKSFTSSDYLLTKLGYDADTSAKRLGDGLFEQRLIQQAVVARTGQRFIDGQTSDEAMFKYLMNNAIASKDALNLSVGVTLTAQQVAALTHDIVWLEEHEVNGEKVLVPVLYLAQANNRLAPNGALIAGQNVTLIAGKDLENAGTLRATNNLSASAGENLTNSGLIEAGNRLDLLAGNDIVNKSGGIIAGRDVSMNAIVGDIINERTLTSASISNKGYTQRQDYADNASRIEAANDLTMGVGRDVNSVGSVMVSGRDTQINAGRDVNIVSAQQQTANTGGTRRSSITQLGSEVDAGRDVVVNAGRDFNAIASQISADRDVALAADENMTISSGANETHSYYKSKKVTAQEDHVKQIGSAISAGGDVRLDAGKDMALISSRINAGDEAYLVAGENLDLLAAQDSDYSLYDKKKKGSWGSKQTRRDEVTKITHVGSEISTGGDLTLLSGDDQRYQVAKLNSGNDLILQSGGSITFESVKDLHQESHEKSKSSAAWFSMKGNGRTDETLRQSELTAQGDLVISAVGKIHADVLQVNKQTVSESIDAMVKADPKLAWLKELDAQGGVDWRQVQEIHTSFKYANSGMGPAAQMIVAILMTVLLGPAGAGLSGATLAGAASLATTGAVATINNNGDLGAGLKAVVSKDGLTDAAIATITAGVAENYLGDMTMTKQVNGKTVIDLSSIEAVSHFVGQQLINNASAAAIAKAFGRDVTLAGILQSTVYNTLAAYSFDQVGNLDLKTGSPEKIALHALVGGMIAEASGSDFAVGAMAAGVNETFANQLRRMSAQMSPENRDHLMLMSSQLLGVVAAAAVAGDDANSLQTGAYVAGNATQYNNLNHPDMSDFVGDMNACGSSETCQKNTWEGGKYEQIGNEITDWSEKAVSGAFAKSLLTSIQGGLTALNDLNCTTATCTQYKDTLTERALNDLTNLAKVTDTWENATSVATLVIPTSGGARGAGVGEGGISPRVQAALDKFTEAKAVRTGASTGKNGSTPLGGPDAEAGMPYTHPVKENPIRDASFGDIKKVLESAQAPYKGSTVVGHALSKHAGRNPDIWGKVTGSMKTWNEQAMNHLREIARAPGEFKPITTDKGIPFLEKRLTDGRGIRLNMDGTFKGFVD